MNLGEWRVLRLGEWAAEEIAKEYGVEISKALNPLDPGDFVTISVRLSAALRTAVKGTESVALRNALDTLDVDWPNLSAPARDKVINAARSEVAALATSVPKLTTPVLKRSALSLVTRTRVATVARHSFGRQIRNEAPIDKLTVANLPVNQTTYIKDQYGRRADGLDAIARETVASGLERGLGRDDISGEIAARLKSSGVVRTGNYWNLIASDFSNKGRTSTQLNTFGRAEIELYKFDAIMDEATSDICRILHGRTFSVKKAADRMRNAIGLKNPEDIKSVMPWVQTGTDKAGNQILYYDDGSGRTVVAHVERSGVGSSDRRGSYSKVMSNKALEAAGLPVPPRHGHCRSVLTAVTD
jgi:SPP1 gp7 family putative phage head morphogenesis protein